MAVRTRRSVYSLTPPSPGKWHPDLLWYARAIAEMQTRDLDDPTSWRYQAAIHDYVRQADPLARPTDAVPLPAEQNRYWRQCQHFSWFFLSWHRMYLFYFEQIVADTIRQLGGADWDKWALPYWNYSDDSNPSARRLPPEFREPTTPDNVANPLLIGRRNAGCNTGQIIARDSQVDITTCLTDADFTADPIGGNPGFGGPATAFNHDSSGSNVVGKLERGPHGAMHMAVGGYMGSFNTAGLDPLFWLHHCNIDRLWTVWQQRYPGHDPADAAWLTDVRFPFRNAAKADVEHDSGETVDSTVAPWLYEYDDVSDPIGQIEGPEGVEMAMADQRIPEMIGATEQPVTLGGGRSDARLEVAPPSGPAAQLESVGLAPKVYLNIENVTGDGTTASYDVYVNVPEGEAPEAHRELYAGEMPMFGLAEATRSDSAHGGSGLKYAFEISQIVQRLQLQNAWDPNSVRVSFVAQAPIAAQQSGEESVTPPVRVGRISVYVK
jgi:tyrosinase